jgi:hypothetical protein
MYTVLPTTLYCLRQQGTSPVLSLNFARQVKFNDKRKKKYRSAEGGLFFVLCSLFCGINAG